MIRIGLQCMHCYVRVDHPAKFPPHPDHLGCVVKMTKSTFSERGHVAYQIKANDACSNMVANTCPQTPPPPTNPGSKGRNSTFSEHGHVAYQLNGITNAVTW